MRATKNRASCLGLLCASVAGLACGDSQGAGTEDTDGTTRGGPESSTSSGDADDTGPESEDSGSGVGPEEAECGLLGFEPEPSEWRLPVWPGSGPAFEAFSGSCDEGSNAPTYATTDLTATGRPDLVVTSACGDGEVGRDHWIVFGNEDGEFGDASQWLLPQWPGAGFPFPALSRAGCSDGNGPDYSVFDLDGDSAPELIVTYACEIGEVGDTRWLVFPNTGQGFGDPTSWGLPDWPSDGTPFAGVGGQERCTPSVGPTYGLLDLTADGRVDLVVTSACTQGGIGDTHWLVFPNEGDGFGEAIAWSLPDWPNAAFAFTTLSGSRECNNEMSPTFALADLDGDAAVDLVVTQTCGDDPIGRERWLVFSNEGDGFGEATNWSLPDWPAESVPFPNVAGIANCQSDSAPTYALSDLDRDHRPDLVVTFACEDADVGSNRWLVFPNDGDGFADPLPFALPPWPGADEFVFDAFAGPGSCDSSARPTFGLIDLLGEGWDALTVTYACGDAELGRERWLQFPRDCG